VDGVKVEVWNFDDFGNESVRPVWVCVAYNSLYNLQR
jgi:hypothetical protein